MLKSSIQWLRQYQERTGCQLAYTLSMSAGALVQLRWREPLLDLTFTEDYVRFFGENNVFNTYDACYSRAPRVDNLFIGATKCLRAVAVTTCVSLYVFEKDGFREWFCCVSENRSGRLEEYLCRITAVHELKVSLVWETPFNG